MILVVVVLGFMMAISTSYTLMVRNETVGTDVDQKYLQARAAAMAGISFVIAQMTATETTFASPYPNRLYFLYDTSPTSLSNRLNGTGIATTTPFPALIATQWYYVGAQSEPVSGGVPFANQFKVSSYPNGNGPATSTYVKSIGRYLDIDPQDPTTVLGTWTAAVIARLNINSSSRYISIDLFRPLPVEACETINATFFTRAQRP